MKTVSIANDFSVFPGGRIPADGPFSGEEFRDNILIPLLKNNEEAIIDFDNVRGYGSSFLEESFGGLLRKGYGRDTILRLLHFKSKKHSVIEEVERYIDNAALENNHTKIA